MAQTIFSNIDPATKSGTQLATDLNNFKQAILSGFSGSAKPSEVTTGGYWIDTSTSGFLILKIYDGSNSVEVLKVNTGTHKVSGLGWLVQSTQPAGASEGDGWYDTTNDVLRIWDGSKWDEVYSPNFMIQARAPSSPVKGHLWYDTTNSLLKVYNGSAFETLGSSNFFTQASAPSNPSTGWLWYSTTADQLSIYNGSEWEAFGTASTATRLQDDNVVIEKNSLTDELELSTRDRTDRRITVGVDPANQRTVFGYTAGEWGSIDSSDSIAVYEDFTIPVNEVLIDKDLNHVEFKLNLPSGSIAIPVEFQQQFFIIRYDGIDTRIRLGSATISGTKMFFRLSNDDTNLDSVSVGDTVDLIFVNSEIKNVTIKDSDLKVEGKITTDLIQNSRQETLLYSGKTFPPNPKEGDFFFLRCPPRGSRMPENDIDISTPLFSISQTGSQRTIGVTAIYMDSSHIYIYLTGYNNSGGGSFNRNNYVAGDAGIYAIRRSNLQQDFTRSLNIPASEVNQTSMFGLNRQGDNFYLCDEIANKVVAWSFDNLTRSSNNDKTVPATSTADFAGQFTLTNVRVPGVTATKVPFYIGCRIYNSRHNIYLGICRFSNFTEYCSVRWDYATGDFYQQMGFGGMDSSQEYGQSNIRAQSSYTRPGLFSIGETFWLVASGNIALAFEINASYNGFNIFRAYKKDFRFDFTRIFDSFWREGQFVYTCDWYMSAGKILAFNAYEPGLYQYLDGEWIQDTVKKAFDFRTG